MKSTAQLFFATSNLRTRMIPVRDPVPGLTAAVVQNAADSFIFANPFDAETGNLVRLINADVVNVSRQYIIRPPSPLGP